MGTRLKINNIVPFKNGVSFYDENGSFFCWKTQDKTSPLFYCDKNSEFEVEIENIHLSDSINKNLEPIYVEGVLVVGEDI